MPESSNQVLKILTAPPATADTDIMATNWSDMISRLESAINARLDGNAVEEYTIRGRNVKYAPLSDLREILSWAKAEQSRANSGGPFAVGVPGRPGGTG